jgi:hypothetical protein
MSEWVLIIALLTPGGDFAGKMPVYFPDKVSCQDALKRLSKPTDVNDPMGMKYKGSVCVTADHWEGRKPMKGVALD